MDAADWGAGYFFWYVAVFGLLAAVGWWGWRGAVPLGRRMRLAVRTGICLVLLGGGGMVIGEGYFLFVYDSTDAFSYLRSTRRWFDRHVATNTVGVRDGEWELDVPRGGGVYRIGLLGDGFVFGQGIEDPADRVGDRLETRLNARGDSVRYDVLPIALPLWDTRTHVAVSRDLAPVLGLDELMLAYNIDDARDLTFVPEMLDVILEQRSAWSRVLAEHSFFFDFWLTRPLVSRGLNVTYGLTLEAYQTRRHSSYQTTRVREVKSVADRLHIPLRVVLVPMLAEPWDEYTFADEHPRLRDTFERYGMEVVDLLDVFRDVPARELWAGPLDPHPNEQAHALAADLIYDAFYQPHP